MLGPSLSVALVVAVFVWFLPQFTSLSDVWTSVRAMTWVEVTVLLVAALWNLATYQFVMVATMPGLTLRQATVSTQTTTAVSNTVVGGAAISLGPHLRDELLVGLLPVADVGVAAGLRAVEQLRQARPAGARAGAAGVLRAPDAPAG